MAGPSLSQLFRMYTDDGDVRALGEVFDRAAPELLTVARHLAGDEAAAEDLVQATFLAAIEHPERFDPSRDLVPWLLGILANKARVARTSGARVPDPQRLPGEQIEDPETDAQLREFMGTLEKALERVPEAYRKVLRIHLSEGKGAEEIARDLERSSGTVRVQLHRGLRHLRRRLPAGFALGGLVLVTAPRGIAAMRAQVLERAGALEGAGTAGVTVAGYMGGILMSKKIAAAVGVVVLASGAWWALHGEPDPPIEAAVTEAAATSLAIAPEEPASPEDRSKGLAPEIAPESTPRAAVVVPQDPYGALDLEWVWKDGTPAAGIGVGAVSMGEEHPWNHGVFGIADENGHVTFERLHEGKIVIQTDRGCSSEFFESGVERGRRTSAQFTVRPGEDVRGRVLDPEGRTVSGALVWITTYDEGGVVVARSSPDGSYFVRAVDRSCNLFATADRFGGSVLESLRTRNPDGAGVLALDLSLRGKGGALEGVVRDPDGKPIEDAWVVIRCAKTFRFGEPEEWPRPWMVTGADGAFRFEGAHVGAADVFVDVEGYAAYSGKAVVESGKTARIDVRMEEGFTVEGTVRTSEESAVAAATVSHGPGPNSPDYVRRRNLSTKADENGRFRLFPIPSGEVDLRAELEGSEPILRGSTKVVGRSGEILRWDPALREGLKIVGRVLDESGGPLEGWKVETGTRARLDFYPRDALTDEHGRFEIRDCADVAFLVAAYAPGGGRVAGALLEDVRPGQGEIVLTATHGSRPGAYFLGRIVDDQGKPLERVSLKARTLTTNQSSGGIHSRGDGGFRIGPVPSGRYEIHVNRKDLPPLVLDPVEIATDEQHDLGTITLKARGHCELVLRREDGGLVEHPRVMLMDDRNAHFLESEDGYTFRSKELFAGEYELIPDGSNVATEQRTVEIQGGLTTRLELRLPAGTRQYIRLVLPEGVKTLDRLRVVVRRSDGTILLERAAGSQSPNKDGSITPDFLASFAPGRYTFEAASQDGWETSGSFEIANLTSQPPLVEAKLVRSR